MLEIRKIIGVIIILVINSGIIWMEMVYKESRIVEIWNQFWGLVVPLFFVTIMVIYLFILGKD